MDSAKQMLAKMAYPQSMAAVGRLNPDVRSFYEQYSDANPNSQFFNRLLPAMERDPKLREGVVQMSNSPEGRKALMSLDNIHKIEQDPNYARTVVAQYQSKPTTATAVLAQNAQKPAPEQTDKPEPKADADAKPAKSAAAPATVTTTAAAPVVATGTDAVLLSTPAAETPAAPAVDATPAAGLGSGMFDKLAGMTSMLGDGLQTMLVGLFDKFLAPLLGPLLDKLQGSLGNFMNSGSMGMMSNTNGSLSLAMGAKPENVALASPDGRVAEMSGADLTQGTPRQDPAQMMTDPRLQQQASLSGPGLQAGPA